MMSNLITKLALPLIFLLLTHIALAQSSQNIVVFGDSLSDIGNNAWVHATGTPIVNVDPAGNKYLWVNYLTKNLFNQSIYNSEKHFFPDAFSLSYAYASADTGDYYLNVDWPNGLATPTINSACTQAGYLKDEKGNILSTCVPGLLKQISLYLEDAKYHKGLHTQFFIWAGANDLFYRLAKGETPATIIKDVVHNITTAKNKLIEHGVSTRQIYVLNLPDLSKIPYAIQHGLELSQLSIAFNIQLEKALTKSDSHYPGLLPSHIISIYDLMNQVINHPEQFNLKNISDSCIEKNEHPACLSYLFFDLKHPTSAMHKMIADEVKQRVNP